MKINMKSNISALLCTRRIMVPAILAVLLFIIGIALFVGGRGERLADLPEGGESYIPGQRAPLTTTREEKTGTSATGAQMTLTLQDGTEVVIPDLAASYEVTLARDSVEADLQALTASLSAGEVQSLEPTGAQRELVISGSGAVEPGNSPGILTATSVDPSRGLAFHFAFTRSGSPNYSDAENSENDVLRLTGETPFLSELDATNAIHVYFDSGSIALDDVFRGGFYSDEATAFLDQLSDATIVYYMADVGGDISYGGKDYALYAGSLAFEVSAIAETANYSTGTENGNVMQLVAIRKPYD